MFILLQLARFRAVKQLQPQKIETLKWNIFFQHMHPKEERLAMFILQQLVEARSFMVVVKSQLHNTYIQWHQYNIFSQHQAASSLFEKASRSVFSSGLTTRNNSKRYLFLKLANSSKWRGPSSFPCNNAEERRTRESVPPTPTMNFFRSTHFWLHFLSENC